MAGSARAKRSDLLSSLGIARFVLTKATFFGHIINPLLTTIVRSIFIANRNFLVRFGGISGEFGRAMFRIFSWRVWSIQNTHGETKQA